MDSQATYLEIDASPALFRPFGHMDQAEADTRKSCLMCRHFRVRKVGHATELFCSQRKQTRVSTFNWSDKDYRRCRERAERCEGFEDMREAS